MFLYKIVILVSFVLALLQILFKHSHESFDDRRYLFTHTMFPWWNVQLGSTKNMSYDLRGDPPIRHSYIGPWNISPYYPIQNKPLYMVS